MGRALWDQGGLELYESSQHTQTRDFRLRDKDGERPELAIAKSTDPAALTRNAVDALGGMKRFISRGDIVAIKPNIGWDRMPVHAANTNPLVVAELVRLVLDAGAAHVVVTDASCNEPNRCFQRSGIWRAAYALGADGHPARRASLPRACGMKGDVLDQWPDLHAARRTPTR